MTTDYERGVREGMRRAAAMFLVRQEDVDAWCEVRIPPASSGAGIETKGRWASDKTWESDPTSSPNKFAGGGCEPDLSEDPAGGRPAGEPVGSDIGNDRTPPPVKPTTPEPRGCPTPGACSCTVTDAERVVVDAAKAWTDGVSRESGLCQLDRLTDALDALDAAIAADAQQGEAK